MIEKIKEDLEDLRSWVRNMTKKERELVSSELDYPYHTLIKFGNGGVLDPAYTRIEYLKQYRAVMNRNGVKI